MLKKFPKTLNDLTGYVVYEPEGYDKTKKYPAIFFFHGIGERGDGSDSGLDNLKVFIENQWNNFMSGLISNKWILIAPQLQLNANWSQNYFTDAIRFAKNYSIDEDRKILMSISLGGQMGWSVPATTQEFAGVLNICPVWVMSNFCNIKSPLWAFHAENDPVVSSSGTKSAVSAINVCQPPVKAKQTILNKNYHEIWGEVLSPVLLPGESQTAWQWMEQQKRGVTVEPIPTPPVQPSTPTVKADASATLTSVTGTTAMLDGSKSSGYKQTSQGYKDLVWNMISQPQGSDWNVFPNFNKTGEKITLQNLSAGEYTFELTAKDSKGNPSTDTVKITVTKGKQQVGTATVDGKAAVLYSDHTWQ